MGLHQSCRFRQMHSGEGIKRRLGQIQLLYRFSGRGPRKDSKGRTRPRMARNKIKVRHVKERADWRDVRYVRKQYYLSYVVMIEQW